MSATPVTVDYIDDVASGILVGQEEAEYLIPPNGEDWEIQSWWGSANPSTDSHVGIIWDYEGSSPEIIALTHASQQRPVKRVITGDGTKKLAIVLRNDVLSSTETLGAGYTYRIL